MTIGMVVLGLPHEIWIAIIAGFPGILVGVGALRAASLREISRQVGRIEEKLDRHIEWHAGGK